MKIKFDNKIRDTIFLEYCYEMDGKLISLRDYWDIDDNIFPKWTYYGPYESGVNYIITPIYGMVWRLIVTNIFLHFSEKYGFPDLSRR